MKTERDSRLFKTGRLPDGRMAFKIILPVDLADLFEEEMRRQERKKLPLARFIIGKYLRSRTVQNEFESATPLRSGRAAHREVPHFEDEPSPQRGVIHRKVSR